DDKLQVIETDGNGVLNINRNDSRGRLIRFSRSSPGDAGLVAACGTDTIILQEFAYDGNNNKVLFTDANGNQTKYTYDAADRMLKQIDGLGSSVEATTSYSYDNLGNVVSIKDGRTHGGPTVPFATGSHAAPASFDTYYTRDGLYRITS